MNHLLKILLVGVLSLILFTSSVSALDVNITESTDTTLLVSFNPVISNISHSPEIWLNNEPIETPIRDKLLLDKLNPDTEYLITIYFSHPESINYPEFIQITGKTASSEHIQLEEVLYTYGYILLILLVLIGIALVKLPFGGFIPLFMALAGVIHYIKYENQEPVTILIYLVLVIISAYIIYIRSDK